jgi:hypothetical protein
MWNEWRRNRNDDAAAMSGTNLTLALAPDVYVAALGDRVIVLDLPRDRYIGLGAAPARVLAALAVAGTANSLASAASHDAGVERLLTTQGLLVHTTRTRRPPVAARPLVASATEWPAEVNTRPDLDGRAIQSSLRALMETQLALKLLPFRSTIAWKDRAAARPPRFSRRGVIDAFAAARPWFPIKPICRLDAVSLSLTLWRNGYRPTLIFGVRLEPFHAHCWVQDGATVLNEPHEGVLQYTPIMMV